MHQVGGIFVLAIMAENALSFAMTMFLRQGIMKELVQIKRVQNASVPSFKIAIHFFFHFILIPGHFCTCSNKLTHFQKYFYLLKSSFINNME